MGTVGAVCLRSSAPEAAYLLNESGADEGGHHQVLALGCVAEGTANEVDPTPLIGGLQRRAAAYIAIAILRSRRRRASRDSSTRAMLFSVAVVLPSAI